MISTTDLEPCHCQLLHQGPPKWIMRWMQAIVLFHLVIALRPQKPLHQGVFIVVPLQLVFIIVLFSLMCIMLFISRQSRVHVAFDMSFLEGESEDGDAAENTRASVRQELCAPMLPSAVVPTGPESLCSTPARTVVDHGKETSDEEEKLRPSQQSRIRRPQVVDDQESNDSETDPFQGRPLTQLTPPPDGDNDIEDAVNSDTSELFHSGKLGRKRKPKRQTGGKKKKDKRSAHKPRRTRAVVQSDSDFESDDDAFNRRRPTQRKGAGITTPSAGVSKLPKPAGLQPSGSCTPSEQVEDIDYDAAMQELMENGNYDSHELDGSDESDDDGSDSDTTVVATTAAESGTCTATSTASASKQASGVRRSRVDSYWTSLTPEQQREIEEDMANDDAYTASTLQKDEWVMTLFYRWCELVKRPPELTAKNIASFMTFGMKTKPAYSATTITDCWARVLKRKARAHLSETDMNIIKRVSR